MVIVGRWSDQKLGVDMSWSCSVFSQLKVLLAIFPLKSFVDDRTVLRQMLGVWECLVCQISVSIGKFWRWELCIQSRENALSPLSTAELGSCACQLQSALLLVYRVQILCCKDIHRTISYVQFPNNILQLNVIYLNFFCFCFHFRDFRVLR